MEQPALCCVWKISPPGIAAEISKCRSLRVAARRPGRKFPGVEDHEPLLHARGAQPEEFRRTPGADIRAALKRVDNADAGEFPSLLAVLIDALADHDPLSDLFSVGYQSAR